MLRDLRTSAWALGLAALTMAVSLGLGRWSGWMTFLLCAIAAYLVMIGLNWAKQLRTLNQWLRTQADTPVTYTLSEDQVTAASESGSVSIPWGDFRSALISDLDTLVGFQRSTGELTIPTGQVPAEAMERLIERLTAHGKQVRDRRTRSA